jgi:hypothetical protein
MKIKLNPIQVVMFLGGDLEQIFNRNGEVVGIQALGTDCLLSTEPASLKDAATNYDFLPMDLEGLEGPLQVISSSTKMKKRRTRN